MLGEEHVQTAQLLLLLGWKLADCLLYLCTCLETGSISVLRSRRWFLRSVSVSVSVRSRLRLWLVQAHVAFVLQIMCTDCEPPTSFGANIQQTKCMYVGTLPKLSLESGTPACRPAGQPPSRVSAGCAHWSQEVPHVGSLDCLLLRLAGRRQRNKSTC